MTTSLKTGPFIDFNQDNVMLCYIDQEDTHSSLALNKLGMSINLNGTTLLSCTDNSINVNSHKISNVDTAVDNKDVTTLQ